MISISVKAMLLNVIVKLAEAVVIIVPIFLLLGCATIHEQCSNLKTAVKYLDYNQCYSEKTVEANRKAQLRQTRGPLFNFGTQSNRSVTCVTYGNQTTCN